MPKTCKSNGGVSAPEWRTGEERVENLPRGGGYPPEMAVKTAYERLVQASWGKQ